MSDRSGKNQLRVCAMILSIVVGSTHSLAAFHGHVDLAEISQSSKSNQTHTNNPESSSPLRTFENIDFDIEPIHGSVDINASAGWLWSEGAVHRMVLERDIDVQLADHRLQAEKASVWLKRRYDLESGSAAVYQIFAVFEDLRSADGTITIQAKTMPVRGVIQVDQEIQLGLTAQFQSPPKSKSKMGEFLERSQSVFAQRVLNSSTQVASEAPRVRPWSATDSVPGQALSNIEPVAIESQSQELQTAVTPTPIQSPVNVNGINPVFQDTGTFSFAIGGRVVIDGATKSDGAVISADGGVTVQYQDPANNQWLDLDAERVVVYTRGDQTVDSVDRFSAGQIEGIYLEGGVFAGDDQWSMRTPRMYLDVVNNKALMLDAVFWTTDDQSRMPLYVRAESIRQRARDEFFASKARISNTAFFEPDLTIGVSDITVRVSQETTCTDSENPTENAIENKVTVEGRNVTLNAGNVPIFWLPGFKGDPSSFPLKQISVGDSNRSGASIKTRWNAISLLKIDPIPGIEVDLNLDYYSERGPGIGVSATWNRDGHRGSLFSYLLANDDGTDVTTSGRRLERDGDNRGIFELHDIWEITNEWTLISQLSYISDETFIPALFEQLGQTREEFTNRLQLERTTDTTQFALEVSSPVNDFIATEHSLQTPGYQVSKVPEARFVSLAYDPFYETNPGLINYSFEARAGVLRLNFSEVDARAYGLTSKSLADDAFGTNANESLGDHFRALGLDESAVTRLDTRHEISSRFDLGPVRVVPFAVGRVTTYDQSFDTFSPDQSDEVRFWGGGGMTVSTTLQKINNEASSRFFDIHRLRHIVEPSLTVWGGDSNFDIDDTPVYDDDVDGLLKGTAVRAMIDQTWQTKRGGIGRWRDVDVLKLRTEYVWSSDTAGTSPIPDFYTTRPELSNPGEYLAASSIWQTTEVLALAGEIVYDLDAEETARASIGAIIEHRPGFTTSIEYREVQPLDATFAQLGARYRLSDKYVVNTRVSYNFDLNDFQSFNAQILRRFQIGTLGARVSYNNIRGETSFGFVFRPAGSSGDLSADPSWGG